ncbi:MAG: putative lipid II flippase FtsW [Acidobacteriota bacterium]
MIRTEKTHWRRDEPRTRERELGVDKALVVIVISLVLFGLVMVYSASAVFAQKTHGDEFFFLTRQAMWAGLGFVAMIVAMSIDYRRLKNPAFVTTALMATVGLLVVVFFFPKINGAHRWIRFGGFFSLQPSEIAKLALVIFLAYFFEKRARDMESFKRTVLPAAIVAGVITGLVTAESDLGTALVIAVIFAATAFYAGARLSHLGGLALAAAPVLAAMIFLVDWRWRRVLAFLNPWEDTSDSSYQVVQSMIAIGSGGAGGLGFAQSHQKMLFLPSAHTDFIFAIIGEEMGLLGAMAVVVLFSALAWRGFRAARCAPDLFGQLLATGITVMLAAQACFNMSVTLSLVPNKGIPLPFISAGGSSVAISLMATGILLNVSKHARVSESKTGIMAVLRGLKSGV